MQCDWTVLQSVLSHAHWLKMDTEDKLIGDRWRSQKKRKRKKRESMPRRWQAVEKSKSGERRGEIYGVSK